MKKRKIKFEIIIADGFTYPEDDGKTNLHLWPVATGKQESVDIDIEFESRGGDSLKEAEQLLDNYIKKQYPNKEYKIYYWWWLD